MQQIVYEGSWERIDSFLTKKFDYSRNFFHHIIKRQGVLVNNKPVKKSYKLKPNDVIQIENLERYLDSSFLEELPFVEIPVILEKEDYLVLNKPKGVLSHPNSIWDLSAPSVVAFLYQKYKDLPTIGNFIRAWLVHRLDKDTDGLMIIAKTEKWLKHFKELFNKKSQLVDQILLKLNKNDFSQLENLEETVGLKKFYKAKVNITPEGKNFLDSIKHYPAYIAEIVKPKVPYVGDYKMGITKILNVNDNLLDLQIITGRTHQIRYHLSQKWLPIIGDKLYWYKEEQPMQLTAYKLDFVDPDGKRQLIQI